MACRRLSSSPICRQTASMPGTPIRLRTVAPGSHVVSAKRNGMQVRRSSTRSQRGMGMPARSPIQPATKGLLRHDPRGLVTIYLEYERLFGPRKLDTVDVTYAAM